MSASIWRLVLINAVIEDARGDPRMLNRLALVLERADSATQQLREMGYGWTGLDLLGTVQEMTTAQSGATNDN